MKKLICMLASAALLGACEQSTTVSAPPTSPVPEKQASDKLGGDKAVDPNTFSRATKPKAPEAKMESSTTTASSPAP